MEFLRRTIDQIKAQLGALSISQRLVIVLLVVVMAGAIWWMSHYAGIREMTPLLNQSFNDTERYRIIQKLEAWDEHYNIKGDQILVLTSRHASIVSLLALAEALPEDISMGWATMLEDVDIFTPESVRESKKQIVLQTQLARTIMSWPGIAKAEVFINAGQKRRLNNITPVASASVSIQTQAARPLSAKKASSIAALVSAANPRMKRQDVQVISNGQIVPVLAAEEEFAGGDYIEQKTKYQKMFRDQILAALPVSNALVVVDVKPLLTKRDTLTTRISEEGQGSLVVKVDEASRADESTSGGSAAEPGVMANAAQLEPSASPLQSQSSEEGASTKQVIPGSIVTKEIRGVGGVEALTATVRIPLSYFEGLTRKDTNTTDQPDPAAVKTIIARELPGLKKTVMAAIGLGAGDEDNVVVNEYWDGAMAATAEALAAAQTAPAGTAGNLTTIAGNYGKHIAVIALAAVSLMMVLMTIRKASAQAEIARADAVSAVRGERPMDAVGLDDGGPVDSEQASGLLAGLEVEPGVIRSRQILDQIRNMVDESPEMAADLVGKWIARDS